jgi:hypothetical protein
MKTFATQTSEFRPLTHKNIEWNATKRNYLPSLLLHQRLYKTGDLACYREDGAIN